MTELRKDLENQVYEAWKGAEGGTKEVLEQELRTLLLNHSQAVMYAILRRTDPALQQEAADKVVLALPTFSGNCLFTTWAHKVLMGVMYDQRRLDRRRKEISVDSTPGFDFPGEPSNDLTDIMLTVDKLLDKDEKPLFEQIFVVGRTMEEAGVELNLHTSAVKRRWGTIQRKLQNAFAK